MSGVQGRIPLAHELSKAQRRFESGVSPLRYRKAQKALIDMQNDVLAYLNAKRHLNKNEREELDQMIKLVSQKILDRRIENNGFNANFNY